MLDLARAGAGEGLWLRAERQRAGRGRQGREWVSPAGNFYASTLVRLRLGDPVAATLALVAGVALQEAVGVWCPGESGDSGRTSGVTGDHAMLKWPNDLLIGANKIAGILLERVDDAVIIGVGVNLAHHPDLPDRPTTSLAAQGVAVSPETFADILADTFARWLGRWRGEGFDAVRRRWLERAHSVGTALTTRLPDGSAADGLFDGLTADGALILRLAGGERHVIHAGDVFLL